MNLSRYAENILKKKGLSVTEENLHIVKSNINRKKEKRYNAVCIGIDGTLEEMDGPDEGILNAILKLLKKHIPIVLITGRGESGLKKFYTNIANRLINEKGLSKELIKNIIAVTNDGEILFYTSEIGGDDEKKTPQLLDKCKLIVDDKD